jgi:general nucleoside transport system ATP-binding protein
MEIESEEQPFVAPPGTPPIVLLRGISKVFPGVIANADIELEVRQGEIHALLGENGAGKSTLMNILTGIYQPDAGEIIIDGYAATFASPLDAIAMGIGMVHQHFKLVQAFTVAENVHLGWSATPRLTSTVQLEARTQALADRFNLSVQPNARVSDLSAGEQQRVEVLRVLAREARVLILDEPTAVLTPAEARELFKALRAFRQRGNAVIFISHKLDEVLEISDRISVLRAGRKIATEKSANCSHRMLANLMVGREIVLGDYSKEMAPRNNAAQKPVLSLKGVSAADDYGRPALRAIDLTVSAGEILGIAGVAGNGQKELSEVLTGLRPLTAGQILINGEAVRSINPGTFTGLGVGHIPEDRLRSGLAPALSVTDNAVLREYKNEPVSHGLAFSPRAATRVARAIAAAANVLVPDFAMPVRNLSGGNQQRLVARREMRIAKTVLIAAYPSRGLDVGAINTMLRYFVELREAGVAVVLVSEELEELFNLSDRIAVLYEGRVMGIFPTEQADLETIGLLMGGQARRPAATVQ